MRRLLGRFLRDSEGSIAIITGALAIPMLFLVGMGDNQVDHRLSRRTFE